MSNEIGVIVCGRLIGIAKGGWGVADHLLCTYYDFHPIVEGFPSGDVAVDYISGDIIQYDAEGVETERCHLLPGIATWPQHKTVRE